MKSEDKKMKPLERMLRREDAEELLSRCVQCGFCNATCPTYLATGLELEGPRGRIGLIKSMVEGHAVSTKTQHHLDRCLTCLQCESTCPSGVEYRRIIDIGRAWMKDLIPRGMGSHLPRVLLSKMMAHPVALGLGFRLGRSFKCLLPSAYQPYLQLPRRLSLEPSPAPETLRTVLLLKGCVQRHLAPAINQALRDLLRKLGYRVIEIGQADCCGAVGHHLGESETAKAQARKTVKAIRPYLLEASLKGDQAPIIMMTSSACGLMLRDLEALWQEDPDIAEEVRRIHHCTLDPVELIERHAPEISDHIDHERVRALNLKIHEPCTFQHGMKLKGRLTGLFSSLGFKVSQGKASHLCCGAGGVYSLMNPEMAQSLREEKRRDLGLEGQADTIALTSNIGCMLHLDSKGDVVHWIEFLHGVIKEKG